MSHDLPHVQYGYPPSEAMTDNKTHSKDDVLRMAAKHDGYAEHERFDKPIRAQLHRDTAAMLRAYAEVVEGWRGGGRFRRPQRIGK